MPHPRPKSHPLIAGLDTKILNLVRQYIDEAVSAGDTTVFHKKSGNLNVTASQLCQYVVAVGDGQLQRTKRTLVQKATERAIDMINSEQGKPWKRGKNAGREPGDCFDEDGEGMVLDSDIDDIDAEDLVEFKDKNTVNKRITELWAVKRTQPINTTTPPPSTRATSAAPAVTPSISLKPEDVDASVSPMIIAAPGCDTVPATSTRKRKDKSLSKKAPLSKRQKVADIEPHASPSNISLSDLGGLDDVIVRMRELVGLPLKCQDIIAHYGAPHPRGVLLHGPPGCGKTMTANAIAGELGFPFISVSAPSIVSGMSGESEKKLRELFDEAREKAPCILFLDEIDAITPKREGSQREMEKRIVAQMLTCMDDLTLEKTGGKPVVVIGATNRPDSLDPALRRAGRFCKEIYFGVPDETGREKILRVLSRKLRLSGDFNFRQLAKMTPGFVGADLNDLTTTAAICAMKRGLHTLKDMVPLAAVADKDQVILPLEHPGSAMDLDSATKQFDILLTNTPPSDTLKAVSLNENISSITDSWGDILQHFLAHPPTPEQLEPLFITIEDFLTALPQVQPSSKREGFAKVPDVTWADVGALHSVRDELEMAIVLPIKHPEKFANVGITAPTSVLLWGPPGCGKTLLAKAIANESKANFISIRGPELLDKYLGESERAVRQVFSRARASTPCVIFFDELDALAPARGNALSDAPSRVVNTLLTELDGLSDNSGVYVIGATNRPDAIDPAMKRPGRLDMSLFIDLPTPEDRVEIIKTLITKNKTPLADDVDVTKLGKDSRCEGFSGADLAALVKKSAMAALRGSFMAIREGVDPGRQDVQEEQGNIRVTMADFDKAFAAVKPSVTKGQAGRYKALASKFGSETMFEE